MVVWVKHEQMLHTGNGHLTSDPDIGFMALFTAVVLWSYLVMLATAPLSPITSVQGTDPYQMNINSLRIRSNSADRFM